MTVQPTSQPTPNTIPKRQPQRLERINNRLYDDAGDDTGTQTRQKETNRLRDTDELQPHYNCNNNTISSDNTAKTLALRLHRRHTTDSTTTMSYNPHHN